MRREKTNPSTHVLVFGLSHEQWEGWSSDLKGVLQSRHSGWRVESKLCATVNEAIAYIKEQDDLELVFFTDNDESNPEDILEGAIAIGCALYAHPHKPWLVLTKNLSDLKGVFDPEFSVPVVDGRIEYEVIDRWATQVPEEVPA